VAKSEPVLPTGNCKGQSSLEILDGLAPSVAVGLFPKFPKLRVLSGPTASGNDVAQTDDRLAVVGLADARRVGYR
jgi:hypothetical protein